MSANLEIDLTPNIKLANPVMIASGTFGSDGYGKGPLGSENLSGIGAVVLKTTTRWPKKGNGGQTFYYDGHITLNSIGLKNPGIEKFLHQKMPLLGKTINTNIILSIAADSIDDYSYMTERITSSDPNIKGIELNLSCPNVQDGSTFSHSPILTYEVVSAVKSRTRLPVFVKLSPNTPNIVDVSLSAEEAGADALTICNTIPAMEIDINQRKSVLDNKIGALSGDSLRCISLALVYKVSKEVSIPIIGVGGISNIRHVLEYILAGATAVQVGTANLMNIDAPWIILRKLEMFLENKGITNILDLRGKLKNVD